MITSTLLSTLCKRTIQWTIAYYSILIPIGMLIGRERPQVLIIGLIMYGTIIALSHALLYHFAITKKKIYLLILLMLFSLMGISALSITFFNTAATVTMALDSIGHILLGISYGALFITSLRLFLQNAH